MAIINDPQAQAAAANASPGTPAQTTGTTSEMGDQSNLGTLAATPAKPQYDTTKPVVPGQVQNPGGVKGQWNQPMATWTSPSSGAVGMPVGQGGTGAQFIDPKLATVEGRMEGIVNGKIGQMARENVKQQAVHSGLLNSTKTLQAGELAALQAAESIATKDAALYGQEALADQRQAQNLQTLATQFGYDLSKMSKEQQYALETLTKQHGFNMEQLTEQLDFNREALEKNLEASEKQMLTQSFGQMFQGFLNNFGAIMTDPNLPGEAKAKSRDQLYDYFKDWTTTLSGLNQYDLSWS